MTKKAYKCEGDFQMGRNRQHFVIQVVAASEAGARDAAFAELGSRHGVKRREVELKAITALAADDMSAITKKKIA